MAWPGEGISYPSRWFPKTVQQLQDHLLAVYEKTVKGAVVTVIVKEIKGRPVYFVGGFGKPGVLQLTGDLTLLQAISIMGGVLPDADAGWLTPLAAGSRVDIIQGSAEKKDRIRVDVDRTTSSRFRNGATRAEFSPLGRSPG